MEDTRFFTRSSVKFPKRSAGRNIKLWCVVVSSVHSLKHKTAELKMNFKHLTHTIKILLYVTAVITAITVCKP